MFNVYLDDVRCGPYNEYDPNDNTIQSYPDWNTWVICRSIDQVKCLLTVGMINNLSLDHDMGEDLPTGMDLVKWMVEYNIFPKGEITIHSANIIGAKNMQSLLDNYFLHHPKGK